MYHMLRHCLLSHWYVVHATALFAKPLVSGTVHATTLFVKPLVCGTCYDIVC